MFDEKFLEDESLKIAHDLAAMCEGRPTAAVYLAVSILLGNMEMKSKRPDRAALFKIISDGMDCFVQANSRGVVHR